MADLSQPYVDIQALLTAVQYQGAPLFKYVADFNDQFTKLDEGQQEAIPLPAALVEAVEPIESNQLGGGLLQADILWRIHIGMEQLDAADGTMGQNVTIKQYRRAVIMALSLKEPTASTPLVLVADKPDTKHTNTYVWQVDFRSGFIDSSGSPYDPDAGVFIQSTPPTALEVDNTAVHLPLEEQDYQDDFNPDYSIEEDVSGVGDQQKGEYIINPEPLQ